MAVVTRSRTTTGAGVLAILILVLAFGNPAYSEWADRHAKGNNTWDLLLRTLAWPRWFLTPGNLPNKDVIAYDLRALLLVVFVALILGLAGAAVAGAMGGFILGWFAVIFGGAVAALLTAFITTQASLYNALLAAGGGSVYGLYVGWIIGLVTAATRRSAGVAATV